MPNSLRCGRIQYTNDLPVYAAFDAKAITYPGTLHSDVPANLNAMLLRGELDLSPISAFTWASHADELVLLPDLCIGARDEVVSVVLVSQVPPSLLDGVQIFITNESASGRNLLRVLMERRYGISPQYVFDDHPLTLARRGHAALLIGDSAIDALLEIDRAYVYDLGTLWHEWKSEQTVFAVWAARRDVFEKNPEAVRACMHALTDAYTWSRTNMDYVVSCAQSAFARPNGFYENYFAKLNFTFHQAARSGLAAYCRELYALGLLNSIPLSVPEALGVVAP